MGRLDCGQEGLWAGGHVVESWSQAVADLQQVQVIEVIGLRVEAAIYGS